MSSSLLSDKELSILTGLNAAASALSFLGSGAIVVSYLAYPELRRFSFRLVFLLSIADLFDCFGSLFGNPSSKVACYFQAWLVQYFSVSSFLWTTVIAFVLYRTVVQHKADVEQLERWFHLYVWGVAFLLALIPQLALAYGQAGFWCWIVNRDADGDAGERGRALRLVCFYVPLWIAIIWNGFAFLSVVRRIRMAMELASNSEQPEDKERTQQLKTLQRLGFYPLILIGAYFFGTVNRMYNFFKPNAAVFVLFALHVSTSSLKGFFNAIAYGLNAHVRKCLSHTFRTRCLPLLRRLRGKDAREDFVQMEEMEGDMDEEPRSASDAFLQNKG